MENGASRTIITTNNTYKIFHILSRNIPNYHPCEKLIEMG